MGGGEGGVCPLGWLPGGGASPGGAEGHADPGADGAGESHDGGDLKRFSAFNVQYMVFLVMCLFLFHVIVVFGKHIV